jgi:hypothetical protein
MGWSLADTAGTCIGIGALRVSTDITFAGIAITENGYGSVANGESVSRDNRRLAKFRGRPRRQRPPNMAGVFYPNSWASLANPNPVALIPYPAGTMAVAAAQTVVAGAAAPIAVHVAAMPSVVRQIPTVVRCAGLRQ